MNFSNFRQSSPGESSLSFNNLLQALEGTGEKSSPEIDYDYTDEPVTGSGDGEETTTTESGVQEETISTPGIRLNLLVDIVDSLDVVKGTVRVISS